MISTNKRDILLLLQLLHTKGLITPESVTNTEPKLQEVATEWFNHKSTQLSIQQGVLDATGAPSVEEVVSTYTTLLECNPDCSNTTYLANKYYFERVKEVEEEMESNKNEFKQQLSENKVQ